MTSIGHLKILKVKTFKLFFQLSSKFKKWIQKSRFTNTPNLDKIGEVRAFFAFFFFGWSAPTCTYFLLLLSYLQCHFLTFTIKNFLYAPIPISFHNFNCTSLYFYSTFIFTEQCFLMKESVSVVRKKISLNMKLSCQLSVQILMFIIQYRPSWGNWFFFLLNILVKV